MSIEEIKKAYGSVTDDRLQYEPSAYQYAVRAIQTLLYELEKEKERADKAEKEVSRIQLGMGNDYGDDPVAVIDFLRDDLEKEREKVREMTKNLEKTDIALTVRTVEKDQAWEEFEEKKKNVENLSFLNKLLAEHNISLEKTMKELEDELKEGDYWQQRATEYLQSGGCPICFATDEEGHKEKCEWGKIESRLSSLQEAVRKYKKDYSAVTNNMLPSREMLQFLDKSNEELYRTLANLEQGKPGRVFMLYAFQPTGHGPYSFFVASYSEDEAKATIERYISENQLSGHSFDGWGTDDYKLTILPIGQVIINDND